MRNYANAHYTFLCTYVRTYIHNIRMILAAVHTACTTYVAIIDVLKSYWLSVRTCRSVQVRGEEGVD